MLTWLPRGCHVAGTLSSTDSLVCRGWDRSTSSLRGGTPTATVGASCGSFGGRRGDERDDDDDVMGTEGARARGGVETDDEATTTDEGRGSGDGDVRASMSTSVMSMSTSSVGGVDARRTTGKGTGTWTWTRTIS